MARVALSFDDGPGPATARLLDALASASVRATFFLLGANVERSRPVAVRMAREGHVLGNHSWTHPKAGAIGEAAFAAEIARTDALLQDVLREAGRPADGLPPVRLPYGPAPGGGRLGRLTGGGRRPQHPIDGRLRALASLGRCHVHWTGDFGDWLNPEPAALAGWMRAHVEAQAAAGLGAVLDLHDSSRRYEDRGATVEAVRLLLEDGDLETFTVPVR